MSETDRDASRPEPAPAPGKRASEGWRSAGALGLEMALIIGLCTWLGSLADDYWQTRPWLLLTGVILGTIAALYAALKVAGRLFQ